MALPSREQIWDAVSRYNSLRPEYESSVREAEATVGSWLRNVEGTRVLEGHWGRKQQRHARDHLRQAWGSLAHKKARLHTIITETRVTFMNWYLAAVKVEDRSLQDHLIAYIYSILDNNFPNQLMIETHYPVDGLTAHPDAYDIHNPAPRLRQDQVEQRVPYRVPTIISLNPPGAIPGLGDWSENLMKVEKPYVPRKPKYSEEDGEEIAVRLEGEIKDSEGRQTAHDGAVRCGKPVTRAETAFAGDAVGWGAPVTRARTAFAVAEDETDDDDDDGWDPYS